MDEQNGEQQKVAQLPAIAVLWDEQTQYVHLQFEGGATGPFKTWDFVLAVLEMAKMKADENRRLAQLANLQNQVAQQAQAQALAQQLERQKIRC